MSHVRYERDGDVAEIVLDSPPLNLFGAALMEELGRAVDQATADGPRALVVRAEGKVFTAGVDVHVFDGLDEAAADQLTGSLLALTHAVEDLPFPVLAVVQGLCLTAGLELALACDLLWAAEEARFGLVEKVVGITPLMGGTQRMTERAGTRPLVMTGSLPVTSTMGVDAVSTTLAPSTASSSTTTPSTTMEREPMKAPSSMITGEALGGSSTPPIPTPPERCTPAPICAHEPTVAQVSTMVPAPTYAPMLTYPGITTHPGSRNEP